MKILKAYRQPSVRKGKEVLNWTYFIVVDQEPPALTYEKIGQDYVGSATTEDGDIISSHFLMKQPFGDAFAGREISLEMKDGSTEVIKDYWFDHGSYPYHGEFTSVAIGTPQSLQRMYAYSGANLKCGVFNKMLEEYLEHDTFHAYNDIRIWIRENY